MWAAPVVYLPGAGGRSSFWRPVADRLSYRLAPIVLGYPGFGDVPPMPTLRSTHDLYESLLQVLPAQFDLVAQSMGGVLALRIAIEHPERVRRLVIAALSGGVAMQSLGAVDWRGNFNADPPSAPTWFIEDRTDVSDRLGLVRAPTLLLFGSDDPIAPAAVGAFVQARIPNAALYVVDGSHAFAHEQPEKIAALISSHLTA
jgi:pimeloyl-ACP methyl ester carboxylesterase